MSSTLPRHDDRNASRERNRQVLRDTQRVTGMWQLVATFTPVRPGRERATIGDDEFPRTEACGDDPVKNTPSRARRFASPRMIGVDRVTGALDLFTMSSR